jgi:hypothetical protein
MAKEPRVRCQRPAESAAAALAAVAQFHDLPLRAGEVATLVGLPAVVELGELVVASRMCGFESVPLGGGFDDLPEVPRPNIVRWKDGRFVVLYEIDASSARVADPIDGVATLSREEFVARWTGDCLQVVPADLDGARAKLAAHRNWLGRLLSPRTLAFAVGVAAIAALVWRGGSTVAAAALGVATLASLWLVLFQAGCAACNRAHQLAGALPLEKLGALFYVALLVASRIEPLVACYALAFAVGAHASLVAILVRERVLCPPCLLTAAAALVAAAASLGGSDALMDGALVVAGAAAAWLAIPFFRRAASDGALAESRRVALEWLKQAGAIAPGQVRVAVWKRVGCSGCLFYEAVHRAALLQDFEGVVTLDERDAAKLRVPTPLVLVAGAAAILFLGLGGKEDDYERLQAAVELARDPALAALAALGRLGGLFVVE